MLVLEILATVFAIGFGSVVALTITHDALPLDKTPDWLENTYEFIWDGIERLF